ncbi:MAG: flagellar basal body L-ring protein FlgH [Bacteroidetes bacterium]|nr:flagellar basal body L-ring protein FlgH [Bacteroidota bacterium]MCW5895086.1 flagellar basal body L-ring protein FlgH [Bacteroidota bacterium]
MKSNIWKYLVLFGFVGASSVFAQDMRNNLNRSLFADQKATQVGDAVTVLILESTSAVNDAKTETSRGSDISLSANATLPSGSGKSVSGGVGTGNQFKGEGSTSNRGSVRAKISAQVDSVLANGNVIINGSRSITINGEEQILKISGIVRPSDIMPDNSVYSFNIADAKIMLQGEGSLTKVQEPGWLTKIFHWLF